MESSSGSDVEAGFAKLQGEDFEYYMQTYSIILGRNSKKSSVDVDLSSLGGGMNISRNHCRIFYDFHRRRFSLQVLGKNGCFVQGVHHLPGSRPVKLDSQDLLSIGDKDFYFLLPVRSIPGGPHPPRKRGRARGEYYDDEDFEEEDDDDDDDDDDVGVNAMVKRSRRVDGVEGSGFGYGSGLLGK